MTTPALPTAVKYGRVTGRFLSAVVDASDADATPDALAVTGTVVFRPSVGYLLVQTGNAPATVLLSAMRATIDASGNIKDSQGRTGVYLIATDAPGVNPTDWTWNATFELANGATRAPFHFTVPSDGEVDLTTVAPMPAGRGEWYIQGPPGPTGPASTAWDNITGKPDFAPTATSNSYNILTDRPERIVFRVLYRNGGYETRPDIGICPPGYAEFVGPDEPATWQDGDIWINWVGEIRIAGIAY